MPSRSVLPDMSRIADPTFGLDRLALPLLSVLSTLEPDFADFDETAQMYDIQVQTHLYAAGDKRWAALVMYPRLEPSGVRTVVTFGRDPNEEAIVVESWGPLPGFAVGGSPTVADAPTGLTVQRFAASDIMSAAGAVKAELARAYRSLRAARDLTAQLCQP